MSADVQQELLQRVRDLERAATITTKPFGENPTVRWAYQVTIRRVGATLRVFLAAGTRTVLGAAAVEDEEQAMGAYVDGAKVYIVRTYPTVTEAGAWGAWKYDSSMPAEDDTRAVYHVATTAAGVPVHGQMGNIRHLDIRRYRTCQG